MRTRGRLGLTIGVVVLLGLGLPAQATLLLTKTWEDGSVNSGLDTPASCESAGCTWAHTLESTAPASGAFNVRFELNGDDPGQVFGVNTLRDELRKYSVHAKYGVERWYGFAIKIDPAWSDSTTDPNGIVVTQWHTAFNDTGEAGKSPQLNLAVKQNTEWHLTSCWDPNLVTTTVCPNKTDRLIGPVTKGVWVRWVVHAKWSFGADGILQVWKDGVQVVNETGPNAYNDDPACCQMGLFFGIYASWWGVVGRPGNDTLITHYDELRMGDQTSSFSEVNPPGQASPPPAAYWKMDESGATTTAVDSSGNGLTLILCNNDVCPQQGPTFAAGEVDNHAVFDGVGDHMGLNHSPLLDFQGDMTFAAWVATTSTAPQQLVSKENTSACGTPYTIELVNSHYLYRHCGPGSDTAVEMTGYTVPTSGVHHVALVRTLTSPLRTIRLYIDGALADTKTWAAGGPATNTVSFRLGRSHVTADPRWFAGTLDAVRMVNYAMTVEEIQALAAEGTPSTFTGLVALHHRWYSADKPEGARPLAPMDGPVESRPDGKLRLRVSVGNDTGSTLSEGMPLTCAVDGGAAFVLSDSCATQAACITTDTKVTNNADTSNKLTIDAGFTFTPGAFINGAVPPWPARTLLDGRLLEHEYSVQFTGLTGGQDLCCKPVYGSTNAAFDSYQPPGGACLTVTSGKQVYR